MANNNSHLNSYEAHLMMLEKQRNLEKLVEKYSKSKGLKAVHLRDTSA